MKQAVESVGPITLDRLLPLGEGDRLTPASFRGGDVRVQQTSGRLLFAHRATWAGITKESELQTLLCTMAPFINAHSTQLFWDFTIEQRKTLLGYKPDGHGRRHKEYSYQSSIPHVGVLVELKTSSTLSKGIGMCWS
jgi:hypothetical protein